jgi:Fibronectin type III domain
VVGRRFVVRAILAVALTLSARFASAELVTRTITLTWNASVSTDVIGYRVRYSTHSGQYSEVLDVGNHTSADIPNLVDGTTYYFIVTAYNAIGEESWPSDELVHTANPALFLNISTRAIVQSDDGVMISGFIIGGSGWKTVIIRALGPSLGGSGLIGTLADPAIDLYAADGLIATNDSWRDGQPEALEQFGFAPRADKEAALVVTLAPGRYTAIVHGNGGSSGIALLEVYDGGIPPGP